MMVLDEKLADHHGYYNSSGGGHECVYQISWQFSQQLSKHFTQNHKCQPHVGARRKSKGISKVTRIHPLGTMNVCTKFQYHEI